MRSYLMAKILNNSLKLIICKENQFDFDHWSLIFQAPGCK